jgi:hypothetical protein
MGNKKGRIRGMFDGTDKAQVQKLIKEIKSGMPP